jgi:hypothetical protein
MRSLDQLFVLKRRGGLITTIRAMLLCALVSHAASGLGDPAAAPMRVTAQEAKITLDVDYSHLPQLTIHARQVSADELMGSLAKELGFAVKRTGRADPSALISGRYVGELPDLLPLLLRGEGYVATFREPRQDGSRALDRLFLLDSHPAAPNEVVPTPLSASEIREVLDRDPDMNKDLRQYLESLASRVESGDLMANLDVDLTDAPRTVTDLLARIATPLDPGFAETRLENIAPGTPPHYLQGANDAAQHSLESALARTTAMAIQNLELLSKSLQGICLEGGCPGITRQEIAEREARMAADQARTAKPGADIAGD